MPQFQESAPDRIDLHQLGPSALAYWKLRSRISAGIVLVVAWVGALLLGPVAGAWVFVVAAALTIVMVGYCAAMPRWRFAVHRWALTETEIVSQSGWLTHTRRLAPLTRLQTVDTEQGPLMRRYGLSTVVANTASTMATVTIPALDSSVAHDVETAVRASIVGRDDDGA